MHIKISMHLYLAVWGFLNSEGPLKLCLDILRDLESVIQSEWFHLSVEGYPHDVFVCFLISVIVFPSQVD